MRVVWTSPARDDLVRQRRYIAERNPIAANRIGAVIVTAAARLGETPALGRPGRIDGTRELVVAGTPFIIAYRLPRDLDRNPPCSSRRSALAGLVLTRPGATRPYCALAKAGDEASCDTPARGIECTRDQGGCHGQV